MRLLWTYLRPHRALVALALLLAAVSQVLALVDPIIFGWIVDGYATNRGAKTHDELIAGVLRLLALAVGVAVLSRLAKAVQEYLTRLVVQKFGTQIFNDGLRQTLRLRYQEFEDLMSREIKAQQRSIVRETNCSSGFISESLRNVELIKSLGLTFVEIRRLQAQTTRIFALEMAKVIEKGRVVESGGHAALLGKKGLYYAMWRPQIGERPVLAHDDV